MLPGACPQRPPCRECDERSIYYTLAHTVVSDVSNSLACSDICSWLKSEKRKKKGQREAFRTPSLGCTWTRELPSPPLPPLTCTRPTDPHDPLCHLRPHSDLRSHSLSLRHARAHTLPNLPRFPKARSNPSTGRPLFPAPRLYCTSQRCFSQAPPSAKDCNSLDCDTCCIAVVRNQPAVSLRYVSAVSPQVTHAMQCARPRACTSASVSLRGTHVPCPRSSIVTPHRPQVSLTAPEDGL